MSSELYADREPIAAVIEGMRVLDSTGKEIGSVAEVRLADPDGPPPRVAPQAAARLTRNGYLKVGHRGLFGKARYAAADDIADVEQDTVTLKVPMEQLFA